MKKKKLFLYLLVLSAIGCKKTVQVCHNSRGHEWHEIKSQIKSIEIKLDSIQVVGWMTPMQVSKDNKHLIILDEHNKRLFYYDIRNKYKLVKCVNLKKELLPKNIMNFIDIGNGEIVFYSYSKHQLIFYSINKNEVLRKVDFEMVENPDNFFKNISPSLPYFTAASPIILRDSLAIGFGYYAGEIEMENPEARTIGSIINLKNAEKTYSILYPKKYWIDNWGGVYFRAVYACYNNKNKNFVLSFPADHNLQVFDASWKETEVDGSSRQNICINPMLINKNSKKMENREYVYNHYASNASYGAIIYDPYRDQYYRILQPAVSAEELKNNATPEKESYLIFLDHNFKYKGELPLPKGIVTTNFFLTEEGLFFLNLNNKNEDIASFYKII